MNENFQDVSDIEPEMLDFARAMTAKRKLRQKTHPHRPRDPWNHYPEEYLQQRIADEYREWKDAATLGDDEEEEWECVDIANMVFFRWKQIKIKRERNANGVSASETTHI